jgi:hypothetical protein
VNETRRGRAVTTAAAVLLLALGGCSGGTDAGAGADCAWELHYGGALYRPAPGSASAKTVPHQGSPVGEGYFAGCQDGGGSRTVITVYRVAGVDPALAVITEDDVIGVTDPDHVPAPLALPGN